MQYLAILQTDSYEWVCLSDNEAEAKQGVYEGFNAYLMRQFEFQNKFQAETTHEYLDSRLRHYYKKNFKGDVSLETLENKWPFVILEIESNECYRDGFKVPRRVQDN